MEVFAMGAVSDFKSPLYLWYIVLLVLYYWHTVDLEFWPPLTLEPF